MGPCWFIIHINSLFVVMSSEFTIKDSASKTHVCMFCREQLKLSRLLRRKHKDETIVAVPQENPFVFAHTTKGYMDHLRGWDCVSNNVKETEEVYCNGVTNSSTKRSRLAGTPSWTRCLLTLGVLSPTPLHHRNGRSQ